MSEMICEWLREEVGMGGRLFDPDGLDNSFATGFLFAQLFHSLKLLPAATPLSSFKDLPSAEVVLKNYSRLEPVFRSVGVALTSSVAYDLICAKKGSAAKMLYQLRIALSDLKLSSFNEHDDEDEEHGLPSAGVVPNISRNKEAFNEKEHAFFVERLRAKLSHSIATTKMLPLSQISDKDPFQLSLLEPTISNSASRSASPISGGVNIKLSPIKVDIDRIRMESHRATDKSVLDRYSTEMRQALPSTRSKSPQHDISGLDEESKKYLQRLRERRVEEEEMKKEHRVWIESLLERHRNLQLELAKKNQEELIEKYLNRKSQEEAKFHEFLDGVRKEKEKILENYKIKQQEYEEIRQKEYQGALELEKLNERIAESEVDETKTVIDERINAIRSFKQNKNHQKHLMFCRELSFQIVELSIEISDKRATFGGIIPKWKQSEMSTLFIKGYPLSFDYTIPQGLDKVVESALELELRDGDRILPDEGQFSMAVDDLDGADLDNYFNMKDAWTSNETTLNNEMLEKVLDEIKTVATKITPRVTMPKLEPSQIKLAILGKPMSGKRTLAQEVSDFCKLTLVDPKQLLSDSINQAGSSSPDSKDNSLYLLRLELVKNIQDTLGQGKPVDDVLMTKLIANELRLLTSNSRGWILIDYPKTQAQAALLEKEMTGYEEPKPSKGAKKPAKKGEVVPPPQSFLDCVLFLEVGDETAKSRAAGRRIDPVSQRVYNLATDSPIDDEPGIYQRLVEIPTPNFENGLISFEENSDALKTWFTKFETICKIDAEQPISNVRSMVEEKLLSVVATKNIQKPLETETNLDKPHLNEESAKTLFKVMTSYEGLYDNSLKYLLRNLRKERNLVAWFGNQLMENFSGFLSRPDSKEQYLETFMKTFESIDEDYLSDPEVKAELHLRTEELKEKLWELCDQRKEMAENERVAIIQRRWFETQLVLITNLFIQFLQSEIEYYSNNLKLIVLYMGVVFKESTEISWTENTFKIPGFSNEDGIFEELLLKTKFTGAEKKTQSSAQVDPKRKRSASSAPTPSANSQSSNNSSANSKKNAKKEDLSAIYDSNHIHLMPHIVRLNTSMDEYLKQFSSLVSSQFPKFQDLPKIETEEQYANFKSTASLMETQLRTRLETIVRAGTVIIREMKDSGYQVFIRMDELLGQQYQTELEQVRLQCAQIRDSIENEQIPCVSFG